MLLVEGYNISQGYAALCGGLGVGLCCLVAGIAVGIVSETGIPTADSQDIQITKQKKSAYTLVGAEAQEMNTLGGTDEPAGFGLTSKNSTTRKFIALCLSLVYCEAIGLYGLIFGLIVITGFPPTSTVSM